MRSGLPLPIAILLGAASSLLLSCSAGDSDDGDEGLDATVDSADDAGPDDGQDGDVAPEDGDDGDVTPEDGGDGRDGDVTPDGGDDSHDGDVPSEDGETSDDPPMQKQVLAFYYPWYRTPEHSGYWSHWNEEGHDPEQLVVPGRRDIATRNYPAMDVYDSLDPAVIDLHIQQSVDAGIDAWIVSWWGDDTEIAAIMERIDALGSPLKVAAYYERIPGCASDGCPELTDEEMIAAASGDMVDLLESLSHDPAWLTFEGDPVLFIYGRAILHGLGRWQSIIERIESTHPVFISGDAGLTAWLPFMPPEFDQLHLYNPTSQIWQFGEESLQYRLFCQSARDRGQSCAVTVIPGYDHSALPSRDPVVIEREEGALYQRLWERSVAADPDWILITSFNEWHEGSEIEPSLEHGDAYLTATAALAESFKTPGE